MSAACPAGRSSLREHSYIQQGGRAEDVRFFLLYGKAAGLYFSEQLFIADLLNDIDGVYFDSDHGGAPQNRGVTLLPSSG